jgi:arylformamidase
MRIHDITMPIHPDMLHWGRRPEVEVVESIEAGQSSNVTRWRIGTHTGTHVDAPAHFVTGATPVDEIDLETLVGPAVVLDLTDVDGEITADHLVAAGAAGHERILLKTTNSAVAGPLHDTERAPAWVGVGPSAAAWAIEHGVRLLGIDYLTIECHTRTDTWDVHHALLPAGVIILENALLTDVEPGAYELVCLPAKLAGADGAFARTVLIER